MIQLSQVVLIQVNTVYIFVMLSHPLKFPDKGDVLDLVRNRHAILGENHGGSLDLAVAVVHPPLDSVFGYKQKNGHLLDIGKQYDAIYR